MSKEKNSFENLKEAVGEAILWAFKTFGGDPSKAARDSRNYSVRRWIRANQLKSGAIGGFAISVPFAHIPLMAGDVAFLLRTMARVSWGIGAIKNRLVVGNTDLEYILAMWCGDIEKDKVEKIIREEAAIKKEYYSIGLDYMDEGISALAGKALKFTEEGRSSDFIISHLESQVPGNLSVKFGGKKAAIKLIAKASGKIVAKGATKVGIKFLSKATSKLGAKLSAQLMKKLLAKMTPKLAAKFGAGFVVGVGALIGGGVNSWFIGGIFKWGGIARHAVKYYEIEKKYY